MIGNIFERELVAICREVDKRTGEISVYELNCPVTNDLTIKLRIRSTLNPELRYFVAFRDMFDTYRNDIFECLSSCAISAFKIKRRFGVVEV